MDLESMLAELSNKIPFLRHILRPEYVPYLITIIAVFVGWLFVSWILNLIRVLLTPVAISVIAVALICPATNKWYFEQLGNIEEIVNNFVKWFQTSQ